MLVVKEVRAQPGLVDRLAVLLVDTVAAGGSVGFMHPLAHDVAAAFWTDALQAAAHGRRIVLGGWLQGELVGTVSLLLDCPPNQPHRADIAKMMTAPHARHQGVASALLAAAETAAIAHNRSLLVLDTAEIDGAAGLYERAGYLRCGLIPNYAYTPHGALTGTVLYCRQIAATPATYAPSPSPSDPLPPP